MGFLTLFGAILSEVFGSSMMKVTAVTNSRLPAVGIILGYGMAFYLLSLALMTIPLSFAYAAWSGVGTALTALIGFGVVKEQLRPKTVVGIIVLIIGLVLMRI